MIANPQPETTRPSRRALLAGALGGLGALAAGAIGRPQVAQGHDVEDVRLGGTNAETTQTWISNTTNTNAVFGAYSTSSGTAVYGSSNTGFGLGGISTSSVGVYGNSSTSIGVSGFSNSLTGVSGYSNGTIHPATVGHSAGDSTGVQGYSGAATLPSAKAKTGVYGYANQDASAKGVVGQSSKGFAGFFIGKVYTTKFHEMKEISAPAAPGANKARLFLKDNGSGKTQLCVRFSTGAIQVVATQP
jgi:hypothetical protein